MWYKLLQTPSISLCSTSCYLEKFSYSKLSEYVWNVCFQSLCKKQLWWKVDFQIETLWHSKIIRFAEQSTRIYLRYLSYLYIRAVVCSTRPKTAWTLNCSVLLVKNIKDNNLHKESPYGSKIWAVTQE